MYGIQLSNDEKLVHRYGFRSPNQIFYYGIKFEVRYYQSTPGYICTVEVEH